MYGFELGGREDRNCFFWRKYWLLVVQVFVILWEYCDRISRNSSQMKVSENHKGSWIARTCNYFCREKGKKMWSPLSVHSQKEKMQRKVQANIITCSTLIENPERIEELLFCSPWWSPWCGYCEVPKSISIPEPFCPMQFSQPRKGPVSQPEDGRQVENTLIVEVLFLFFSSLFWIETVEPENTNIDA